MEDYNLYNKNYYVGGTISGYSNYDNCRNILRDFFDLTLKSIKEKPKTYLDVGCAYGFTIERAIELGIDAYGVEPPTYALEKAKEKPWSNRISEDSLPSLKTIDKTFELITCIEVLEHVPEKDIEASVKRLFAQTSKTLCLLPNYCRGNEATHISCFPRDWWESLFTKLDMQKFRNKEAEKSFDDEYRVMQMCWNSRFFVFNKL